MEQATKTPLNAWPYSISVLGAGAILALAAFRAAMPPTAADWLTLAALAAGTTLTGILAAKTVGKGLLYSGLTFLFAGLLLLPPYMYVLLASLSHLVLWLLQYRSSNANPANWYWQPFQLATDIIAGCAALWVLAHLGFTHPTLMDPAFIVPMIVAACAYLVTNHLLNGQLAFMTRRVSWGKSGRLSLRNITPDLAQIMYGYVLALLWHLSPWFVVPALFPLILIKDTLKIPGLEEAAQTDPKTGLWNARHLSQLLTTEVIRARRFDRPLAVMMADLDLLRNINNDFGHLAGDVVLTEVADIIRKSIREFDIAGRFGGEEFVVILPEASVAQAQTIAERIRKGVEDARFTIRTSAAPIHATISLGIACLPGDARSASELIHLADVAVYQAKHQGRNCVVLLSQSSAGSQLQPAAHTSDIPTPQREMPSVKVSHDFIATPWTLPPN